MKTRKKTTKKPPSAKQIAARKRFVAAVKAGKFRKGAKKRASAKNPRGKGLRGAISKQERQYEAIKKTERKLGRGLKKAKSIAAATVRKLAANPKRGTRARFAIGAHVATKYGSGRIVRKADDQRYDVRFDATGEVERVLASSIRKKAAPKRRNKTIIKAKRVTILNLRGLSKKTNPPRKHNITSASDLVYAGTAKSVKKDGRKVWAIGKHEFTPTSARTQKIGTGLYLDNQSGDLWKVRAKSNPKRKPAKKAAKKRNADHRDGKHPIEVTHHWRKGPKGYKTQWQRAHEAGQGQLFQVKNPKGKKRKTTKRRNSGTPAQRLQEFRGYPKQRETALIFPNGTPKDLYQIGPLLGLKLVGLPKDAFKIHKPGSIWVCADTSNKIHFGRKGDGKISSAKGFIADASEIDYRARKPHLNYPNSEHFTHEFNRSDRPKLYGDGEGGIYFRGGGYTITPEGIDG